MNEVELIKKYPTPWEITPEESMRSAMDWCFKHLPACKVCGSHFWWITDYSISIGKAVAHCYYCRVYEVVEEQGYE